MTLLLTRKENESIVIVTPSGDQIVMTVETIERGRVNLRYSAPANCGIWRDELLEHNGNSYEVPARK